MFSPSLSLLVLSYFQFLEYLYNRCFHLPSCFITTIYIFAFPKQHALNNSLQFWLTCQILVNVVVTLASLAWPIHHQWITKVAICALLTAQTGVPRLASARDSVGGPKETRGSEVVRCWRHRTLARLALVTIETRLTFLTCVSYWLKSDGNLATQPITNFRVQRTLRSHGHWPEEGL